MAEGREKRRADLASCAESPAETGQSSEALGLGLSPSLPLGWGLGLCLCLGLVGILTHRVKDRLGLARQRRGADTFLPLEQSLEPNLVLVPES